MFDYKELLNLESALLHLIQEVRPHDQSEQMRLWRDELHELLVKVQAGQEGFIDEASQAD